MSFAGPKPDPTAAGPILRGSLGRAPFTQKRHDEGVRVFGLILRPGSVLPAHGTCHDNREARGLVF